MDSKLMKTISSLLIIMIITISYSYTVHSYDIDEMRHLTIVAVSLLPNGSYSGVSAELYTRVTCPGGGHVYVETLPLSELDLQASTRIAAIVASAIAGVDFRRCDFYASIRANSPIIGGPSASAATAIAFAAALLRLPLNSSVIMTGMIMPDGSIGPVGGIKYKLDAAYSRGAKIFLVPYGQTIDYVHRVITEKVGAIIIRRSVVEPIDLVRYGESLGIRVIPVSDVYSALEIFTNGIYKLRQQEIDLTSYISNIYNNVKPILQNWIIDLSSEINIKLSICNNIEYNVVKNIRHRYSQGVYNYIISLLANINKSIEENIIRARDMELKNNLYSAASIYFRALIYVYTRLYLLRAIDDNEFIKNEVTMINNSANDLIERIHSIAIDGIDMQGLSIAINILDRAYEAIIYANKTLHSDDIVSSVNNLAYASARLYTARLWSNLLRIVTNSGRVIQSDNIKDMSIYIDTLARSIYTYIISLSQDAQLSEDIDIAIHRYRIAQNTDNELDKLALGISSISYMYLALVKTFTRSPDTSLHTLNKTVYTNLVLLNNTIPLDVILYLELTGNTFEDYESQIVTLTKISTLLSIYRVLKLVIDIEKHHEEPYNSETLLRGKTITITKTITSIVTTLDTPSQTQNLVTDITNLYIIIMLIGIIVALITILMIVTTKKLHTS